MPHVSGHNPGSSGVVKSSRPKLRPKKVPTIKPRVRPSTVKQDAFPVPRQGGGGGPKGGGPASIDPTTKEGQVFVQKYNTDGRYGYYNTNPNHEKYALGEYVPAFRDMMDGGGYDANDTFFKGAGPISTLLNVAKIAPYGQSQTPREQIGFRDITDMGDRGGPQHSGGKFEGGGTISMMGNLMDKLSGREETPKTRYYEGPASVGLMDVSPPQEPEQRNYVGSGMNPGNAYVSPTGLPDMRMPANAAYMPPEMTTGFMSTNRLDNFNRLMQTVPPGETDETHNAYRDYVLNGGMMTFQQVFGQ